VPLFRRIRSSIRNQYSTTAKLYVLVLCPKSRLDIGETLRVLNRPASYSMKTQRPGKADSKNIDFNLRPGNDHKWAGAQEKFIKSLEFKNPILKELRYATGLRPRGLRACC